MLFFLSHYTCDYGTPEGKDLIRVIPNDNTSYSAPRKYSFFSSTTWENFRIRFDYTYIDGNTMWCQNVDDIKNNNYCVQGDLKSPEKIANLKSTLMNLENYLNRLIKVHPSTSINLYSDEVNGFPANMNNSPVTDADLYVTVYPRAYGGDSNTLASAGSYSLMNPTSSIRPTQGFLNINFNRLTGPVSNYNSVERSVFETLFHEICHALGIASDKFVQWQVSESDTGLIGSAVYHQCTKKGKTFKFIHTPGLVALLKKRYGLTGNYFDDPDMPNCMIGLEIENNGGSGTEGSHWELRTYFTEVMAGITVGYASISDITLTALEDSYWYQVDHTQAEPLFFGDYKSIIGQSPWTTFPTGSPVQVFPSHYLGNLAVTGQQDYLITYDFRGIGLTKVAAQTALTPNDYCYSNGYPQFYDPAGTGHFGSTVLSQISDCIPVISMYGNTNCRKETTVTDQNYGTFGPESFAIQRSSGAGCAKMTCDRQNNLFVSDPFNPASSVGCTKGQTIYGTFICPDPNIICGIINYGLTDSSTFCLCDSPTCVADCADLSINIITDLSGIEDGAIVYSLLPSYTVTREDISYTLVLNSASNSLVYPNIQKIELKDKNILFNSKVIVKSVGTPTITGTVKTQAINNYDDLNIILTNLPTDPTNYPLVTLQFSGSGQQFIKLAFTKSVATIPSNPIVSIQNLRSTDSTVILMNMPDLTISQYFRKIGSNLDIKKNGDMELFICVSENTAKCDSHLEIPSFLYSKQTTLTEPSKTATIEYYFAQGSTNVISIPFSNWNVNVHFISFSDAGNSDLLKGRAVFTGAVSLSFLPVESTPVLTNSKGKTIDLKATQISFNSISEITINFDNYNTQIPEKKIGIDLNNNQIVMKSTISPTLPNPAANYDLITIIGKGTINADTIKTDSNYDTFQKYFRVKSTVRWSSDPVLKAIIIAPIASKTTIYSSLTFTELETIYLDASDSEFSNSVYYPAITQTSADYYIYLDLYTNKISIDTNGFIKNKITIKSTSTSTPFKLLTNEVYGLDILNAKKLTTAAEGITILSNLNNNNIFINYGLGIDIKLSKDFPLEIVSTGIPTDTVSPRINLINSDTTKDAEITFGGINKDGIGYDLFGKIKIYTGADPKSTVEAIIQKGSGVNDVVTLVEGTGTIPFSTTTPHANSTTLLIIVIVVVVVVLLIIVGTVVCCLNKQKKKAKKSKKNKVRV